MPNREKLSRAEQKVLRPLQILEAAFEEFVAKGFSATRLEDIADRVGVTKGTIYIYFATKEDLFSAMLRHISKPLEELLADSFELTGTSAERLQTLLTMFYERVSGDRRMRELMRLVISEGARFPQAVADHYNELIGPLFQLTQSILDEGVAAGEFRASAAAFAPVVSAPIIAMMLEMLMFGRPQTEEKLCYIRAHIDLAMNGLAVVRT